MYVRELTFVSVEHTCTCASVSAEHTRALHCAHTTLMVHTCKRVCQLSVCARVSAHARMCVAYTCSDVSACSVHVVCVHG